MARLITVISAMLTVLCMTASVAAAEAVIAVQYRDKPPYSYTDHGKPSGFLIDRSIEIFRRAGVSVVFEEMPVKRIVSNIQTNAGPICSPGWYKLPERELFARFSLPIHLDKPHIILTGAHVAERVRAFKTLRELLASPGLTLGKVSGASYGAELDAMIQTAAQSPMDSTVTPVTLARMIGLRRADYMLIDQEDYGYFNLKGDVDAEGVVPFRFSDMPAGLKRFFMCSNSVSPEALDRINKAIAQVMPGLK